MTETKTGLEPTRRAAEGAGRGPRRELRLSRRPSERITAEVTSWPGVEAGPGKRGEFAFTLGRRELGHLHGDHALHIGFPKSEWHRLHDQGRIDYHPIFPGKPGYGARRIESEADVRDAIEMLRMNYDRARPEAPVDGLWPSRGAPLPFAKDLRVRAFLLRRDAGNILIGAAPELAAEARSFESLGGVSRRYLGHWHEAMFDQGEVEPPLFVHAADRAMVWEHGGPVRASFSKRHRLDDDFEVIPIPGHTPGSTAYLWESSGRRLLFTADSLYLRDDEWVAAMLDSSDRAAYIESLEVLREIEFDVLVPWAASAGQPYYAETDPEEARGRIGEVIERLRAGADS